MDTDILQFYSVRSSVIQTEIWIINLYLLTNQELQLRIRSILTACTSAFALKGLEHAEQFSAVRP
jgi:hypothetical protein